MERRVDFLQLIGEDAAAKVLVGLDDPADLLRASVVSNSWHQFVIRNGLVKKLCERMCPELSIFTSVAEEISSATAIEGGSSRYTEWEMLKREHRVYSCLSHLLVLPMEQDCILKAIGASSTDNYPDESINNTLEPGDRGTMRPSYWSSKGEIDPSVPENLTYKLKSNLCIVNEIKIHPFKAFFQFGHPIYSAKAVRFRLGFSIMAQETASDDEVLTDRQYTDDYFIWMYVSPEFQMLQENTLQSFKLPRPVLCIGGIVQIELLGRVQRQELDQLFYFGVRHVKVMGCNLSPVFNYDNLYGITSGPVLKFFPDAKACECAKSEAQLQHTWQQIFTTWLRKLRWKCTIFTGSPVAMQKVDFQS